MHNKSKEQWNKEQSELYKDPRWQKKRLEILEYNKWTCESCHSTENTLNVHHKYYEENKKPWDYEDEAFTVLCNKCHKEEHSLKNSADKKLIECFRKNGFNSKDLIYLSEILSEDVFDYCPMVFCESLKYAKSNHKILDCFYESYLESINKLTRRTKNEQ